MAKCRRSNVKCKGIAALPTVLLIGGFIAEIVIIATVTSFLLVRTEYSIRFSNEAYFAALSGIEDGIIKIVRDKTFTSSSYNITSGDATAEVVVCKDVPCTDDGKSMVTSIGTYRSRLRKLEAVLTVDAITGKVSLESLKEVQL